VSQELSETLLLPAHPLICRCDIRLVLDFILLGRGRLGYGE